MSHEDDVLEAYEAFRLADMGARGAAEYAALAARDRELARAELERRIKGLPNRTVTQ